MFFKKVLFLSLFVFCFQSHFSSNKIRGDKISFIVLLSSTALIGWIFYKERQERDELDQIQRDINQLWIRLRQLHMPNQSRALRGGGSLN